jgi:hypothetical protein
VCVCVCVCVCVGVCVRWREKERYNVDVQLFLLHKPLCAEVPRTLLKVGPITCLVRKAQQL